MRPALADNGLILAPDPRKIFMLYIKKPANRIFFAKYVFIFVNISLQESEVFLKLRFTRFVFKTLVNSHQLNKTKKMCRLI
jgi:hypothetical protein